MNNQASEPMDGSQDGVINLASTIPPLNARPGTVLQNVPSKRDAAMWPVMATEAFHGLAGEFVRLVEPHTESDTAALLLQFLIGFGNLIGKGAHSKVEADTHCCNLFGVAVGETAKGRKGTSWGR